MNESHCWKGGGAVGEGCPCGWPHFIGFFYWLQLYWKRHDSDIPYPKPRKGFNGISMYENIMNYTPWNVKSFAINSCPLRADVNADFSMSLSCKAAATHCSGTHPVPGTEGTASLNFLNQPPSLWVPIALGLSIPFSNVLPFIILLWVRWFTYKSVSANRLSATWGKGSRNNNNKKRIRITKAIVHVLVLRGMYPPRLSQD